MHELEQLAPLGAGFVGRVEPVEDACQDAERVLRRHPRAAGPDTAEQPRERLALDVVHDEEQLAAFRDDIDDRHDVRWRMRAARRASSTNTETNSGSFANWAWSRLIATVREKPTGPSRRPRCTVAIPPDAIVPAMACDPITVPAG